MRRQGSPRPVRPRRRSLAAGTIAALAVSLAAAVAAPQAGGAVGPLPSVEDFEGTVDISTGNPGIFTFGSDDASHPTLNVVSAADVPDHPSDNHALDVAYTVGGYGGFSDDLAAPQDWSPYNGFSFWVKGSNTGQSVEYEIKDGGADAEHAELWQGHFTDDSTGWKQVKIPFDELVRRADYQPTGAPNDGLNLTSMWGFAINLPSGGATGDLTFDDFAVYGKAGDKPPRVAAGSNDYFVDPGQTATVPVTLTTANGDPTTADATVDWKLTPGQGAVAGTDYTDDSGTLDFPAGTASGTTKTIQVETLPVTGAGMAKTIGVTLSSDVATLTGPQPTVVINAHGYAYLNTNLSVAKRVQDLMSHMTLADKVGQMTQAERAAVGDGTDITTYRLGSLLSGGGSTPAQNTPAAWADMVDGFQRQAMATPLQIPMIYGIDSVHGDNNLAGATLFPHNIGIGATRDPAIARAEGHVTAVETRATGIPWAFSPCVCVSRDERWGRTYESYGEDPALVEKMETVIDGLQNNGDLSSPTAVLGTAKHFLGDGGTKYGTGSSGYPIDQGVTKVTEAQLNSLFVGPYKLAVQKGIGSVMPSYSSLQILGKDAQPVKMHARKDMITGLLKQKLGFKGFVISDYAAIDQINPNDYLGDVRTSINAGLDMIMVPNNYKTFITDLTSLAGASDGVPLSRIDDAVKRILTEKFDLGLFDHPYANRKYANTIGDAAHRAIARKAAAESQVLLKNSGAVLPLKKTAKIYVAGSNADDAGNQTGGWTLTWQGQSGAVPGVTTILSGMKQVAPKATITYSKDASAPTKGYSVGVVVVGETPYAEGHGDIGNEGHTFQLSVADRNAVDTVCAAMKCVVLDVSGRPMDITGIVPEADGVVASWLPGSEGEGVADVLFGSRPFTGRLPLTWAKAESQIPINVGDKSYDPLYPYGWGLRTDSVASRFATLLAQLPKGTARTWVRRAEIAKSVPQRLLDLQYAGAAMGGRPWVQQDLLVSIARQYVQAATVANKAMTAAASDLANAETKILTNHPSLSIGLMRQAYTAALKHGAKLRALAARRANGS